MRERFATLRTKLDAKEVATVTLSGTAYEPALTLQFIVAEEVRLVTWTRTPSLLCRRLCRLAAKISWLLHTRVLGCPSGMVDRTSVALRPLRCADQPRRRW